MVDCGSLFQGICTLRSLRNISIVEAHIKEPVVANNATASTVAFIAPGPPNPPITQVCLLFTRGIIIFYRPQTPNPTITQGCLLFTRGIIIFNRPETPKPTHNTGMFIVPPGYNNILST